jgi:hypothetical protein
VNKTFIAGLAGALAVLVVVGAFLVLDRTTLHWYSGEAASSPTSTSTPTATPSPSATPTMTGTVPPTAVPPVDQAPPIPTPRQLAVQPTVPPAAASPRFQPAEAASIAARYWISSNHLPSEEIYGCETATWVGTAWRVTCQRSICVDARPGSCDDISPIVLCVYEASSTVRSIWPDESC